jgi:hypothetical protein
MKFFYGRFKRSGCRTTAESDAITVSDGTHIQAIDLRLRSILLVGGPGKGIAVTGHSSASGNSLLSPSYDFGSDDYPRGNVCRPKGEIGVVNEW